MALKAWIKDGKLVVDGTGKPILCEVCPCDTPSIGECDRFLDPVFSQFPSNLFWTASNLAGDCGCLTNLSGTMSEVGSGLWLVDADGPFCNVALPYGYDFGLLCIASDCLAQDTCDPVICPNLFISGGTAVVEPSACDDVPVNIGWSVSPVNLVFDVQVINGTTCTSALDGGGNPILTNGSFRMTITE